jgi:hypothetical protein
MSQPPWDPSGQQGQEPRPGEQYGPPGAQPPPDPRRPPPGWYADPGGQPVPAPAAEAHALTASR